MSDQPYHHGDLRRTLMEAAATSIEEAGVDALSLRQLARDAGVSHAAPSRHFRDKQALLDALAEDGFRRLTAALAAISQTAPLNPEDAYQQFTALARCYVEFAAAQPTLLSLMFGMKHAPDARTELLEAGHSSLELTTSVVVQMQEIGAIRSGDPQEVAFVIFAAVHGVATLTSGGFLHDVHADGLIEHASRVIWRGLQ